MPKPSQFFLFEKIACNYSIVDQNMATWCELWNKYYL